MTSPEVTADTVARWMHDKVMSAECLAQYEVVYEIDQRFGERFTYVNDNGGRAIDKVVLRKFTALNRDTVVWSRGHREWRVRTEGDAPGRQQQ
jgi:hypothetical protein